MRITMVGHCTVLIEAGGTRLLTDPYFGRFGNLAYARIAPPAMERSELGDVDGVLVSHGHWDHTDRGFFRGLDPAVPVLVPRGTSVVFKLKGARRIVALRRWQDYRIGDAVITAVPATHMARTCGYVVKAGSCCLYFAGDTYYRPFMGEIGRRYHPDVALLPVTTYRIPMTMGPRGAVRAARDLAAPTVIPIHLGIRMRSPVLRTRRSVNGLEDRLRDAGLTAKVVRLAEGQTFEMTVPSAGSSAADRESIDLA